MTFSLRDPRGRGLAFALGVLTLAAAQSAPAQDPRPILQAAPALSAEETAKNVESFDVVWKTIRDTHFDPSLGGVDWNAVRDELRPKVEKAASKAEARGFMTEALGRLHQSHFGIIPSDAYKSVGEISKGSGEAGIDVRIVDGKPVVVGLLDDSSAAKAGVKMGWIVDKIDGKPTAEILAAVEKAYAGIGLVEPRKALMVMARLSGPIGGTIAVDFLGAQDEPIRKEIPLEQPQGVVARFSNLPAFYVRFVSKRVDQTVGYVALNAFFDPVRVLGLYAKAIEANRDAEGLIIDLRGNPGGIGAMSIGMGGWLISGDNVKLGSMMTRDSSIHFALNPRSSPYEGKVAVLVDELSMSTSEILAGGLKDLNRARIFGAKTPGAALPSRFDILPNGDRFQYAFANYISTGGKALEGIGVTPDVSTPLSRPVLLEGRDAAVEAAVRWIREPQAKP